MEKYYILPVYGCLDPEPFIGPFDSYELMLQQAKLIRLEQDEEDALFWVRTKDPDTTVNCFISDEIDPQFQ